MCSQKLSSSFSRTTLPCGITSFLLYTSMHLNGNNTHPYTSSYTQVCIFVATTHILTHLPIHKYAFFLATTHILTDLPIHKYAFFLATTHILTHTHIAYFISSLSNSMQQTLCQPHIFHPVKEMSAFLEHEGPSQWITSAYINHYLWAYGIQNMHLKNITLLQKYE